MLGRPEAAEDLDSSVAYGLVAECVELPMVTQGWTLGDVTANLCEAISLHLDGENLATLQP
ncbi:MAG: hypothetical protein CTY16_02385 [Methylobacter sp.]|nr:MAG: hypothetical protein CTY16_02385 [Methylobacter sp.]